ncbi:hypothetical protein [Aquimarina aggregata]|uniref:hypothetical protein n=1 Tax=Aquimarina aggregata TaxID=1642818 RepID=UPI00249023DD|nr:hypothetical protein [Aquimarina aggregata]
MERKTNFIGYPIVIILTALITYFCIKKIDSNPVDPSVVPPPPEIITLQDAFQLYETYSKNRACIIDVYEGRVDSTLNTLCTSDRPRDLGFVPSRSFELEKEFLEQYLAYIDYVTGDSIPITGYRIFLGNYPNKDKLISGRPIPDPRRNTIFIAPTTFQNGLNQAFTFTKDQNNDGRPDLLFLKDTFEKGVGNQNHAKAKINTASFFSFSAMLNDELSTIANDIGSYP